MPDEIEDFTDFDAMLPTKFRGFKLLGKTYAVPVKDDGTPWFPAAVEMFLYRRMAERKAEGITALTPEQVKEYQEKYKLDWKDKVPYTITLGDELEAIALFCRTKGTDLTLQELQNKVPSEILRQISVHVFRSPEQRAADEKARRVAEATEAAKGGDGKGEGKKRRPENSPVSSLQHVKSTDGHPTTSKTA